MIDLSPHIETIARRLLGAPHQESTRVQLRFGTNAGLAVEIAGAKRGQWYDHEIEVGGGPLQLIEIRGGMSNGAALNWLRDMGINTEPERQQGQQKRIVATYDYRDESGATLYQALRYEPRGFKQRRPDGTGWVWKLDGVRRVPYRLPELIAAPLDTTIYIVEGEKDVGNLVKLGLVASCNSGGAGKWAREFNQFFRGRDVVILPDNDDAGRDHARAIADSLAPIAIRVRVTEFLGLPPKGDVSDWLDAGHTREELERLVADAEPFGSGAASQDTEEDAAGPSADPNEEEGEDFNATWAGSSATWAGPSAAAAGPSAAGPSARPASGTRPPMPV